MRCVVPILGLKISYRSLTRFSSALSLKRHKFSNTLSSNYSRGWSSKNWTRIEETVALTKEMFNNQNLSWLKLGSTSEPDLVQDLQRQPSFVWQPSNFIFVGPPTYIKIFFLDQNKSNSQETYLAKKLSLLSCQ